MASPGSVFRGVYNATESDLAKTQAALDYLSQDTPGSNLIDRGTAQQADLVINHDGKNATELDPNTGQVTIYWDPDTAIATTDSSGNPNGDYESPASNLAHELSHGTNPYFAVDVNVKDSQYDNLADKLAIQEVNSIVAGLGEASRNSHSGNLVTVENPTEHTNNGQWTEVGSNGQTYSSPNPDSFPDNWSDPNTPYYDPYDPIGDPYYGDGGGQYGYYATTDSKHPIKKAPTLGHKSDSSSAGTTTGTLIGSAITKPLPANSHISVTDVTNASMQPSNTKSDYAWLGGVHSHAQIEQSLSADGLSITPHHEDGSVSIVLVGTVSSAF